jgi:predicted amidophosphoribosyltransferase
MQIKEILLTFLEKNLFLKNGTCPICGKVLFVTDNYLCRQCWEDLPRINNPTCERCGRPIFRAKRKHCSVCAKQNLPFAGGYAYLRYEDSARDLVHAIKFKDRPHLGIWTGVQMGGAIAVQKWAKDIDYIVPVPLHPNRLGERGYNQSEKIARGILEGLVQADGGVGPPDGTAVKPLSPNLRPPRRTFTPSLKVPSVRLGPQYLRRSRDTPHQIGQGRAERLRNLTGAFSAEYVEDIQGKTILLVDDVLTTGATLSEASATLLEAGAKRVYIATVCAVAE